MIALITHCQTTLLCLMVSFKMTECSLHCHSIKVKFELCNIYQRGCRVIVNQVLLRESKTLENDITSKHTMVQQFTKLAI